MTIQARTHNASKATLSAALSTAPGTVRFEDPSIFPGSRGLFTGDVIQPGESFPVVMDHPRRTRFATIQRRPDGTFKVT